MDTLALDRPKDLQEYLDGFLHRRLAILVIAATLFALSLVVAWMLPPVYRSTATILIEEQEIPADLVRSTVTSYADQRIQVIGQQVMTRARLDDIIRKFDLYAKKRRFETSEEILERMRKDIKVDMVTANVTDRRSGSRTVATIAFTLGFESDNPVQAQKVANELTSLYLNENLEIRRQKSAETSRFLGAEADRLREHIGDIESRLAAFKSRNLGQLPEQSQINMQMRDRTEAELMEAERQLASLEERRFYLETQLPLLPRTAAGATAGGERVPDPEERLRALKSSLAAMAGVYAPGHPDMVRTRQQIESLEKEVGTVAGEDAEIERRAERLREQLATLSGRYVKDHPDVVAARRTLAALEEGAAQDAPTASAQDKPRAARTSRNPALVSYEAQIEALRIDQQSLRNRREELRQRLGQIDARLQHGPTVESEYLDLSRERESSVVRYREIRAKLMEAQVAQDLEKDRKSERFSLIDPPLLPEKPRSPNRPAIVLIGAMLALGGGIGVAGAAELLDRSVKGSRDLARVLRAPLLSVIPVIADEAAGRRHARRRWIAAALAALAAALALAAVHFLWLPLDVLWFAFGRKAGIF